MQERIVIDPQVCAGKPCVRGTRIPIHMVLDLLEEGLTPDQILADYYPQLTREDILACIGYANRLVKDEDIHLSQP